jgi:hypothetical protein
MLKLNNPVSIKSALVVVALALLFTVGATKVIASCCGPVFPPGHPKTCRSFFSTHCWPLPCVTGQCILNQAWMGHNTGDTVSCADCGIGNDCAIGNDGCCAFSQ